MRHPVTVGDLRVRIPSILLMKIKITKEDCEDLRKETGYSLMDCKYGLIKANGDRVNALIHIQNKLKHVLK
jgi:hypothetical protein